MQNRMLSEYRLFAGLSEEECQAVLGCIGGWESPAQKGELLAHAGEELAAMGLVLEGRVDILSTDYWGSETLMARLGPGELFGEVFAGQGVELPYDLVAAEDCRILWLRPDRLMTGCCEACGFHQRLQRRQLRTGLGQPVSSLITWLRIQPLAYLFHWKWSWKRYQRKPSCGNRIQHRMPR